MRFVIFTHSLVSDWNHGNAHFLRGLATELVERGHDLRILEPRDGWSRRNLLAESGVSAIEEFEQAYPRIRSTLYDLDSIELSAELRRADVAIVHEWNPPELIAAIGKRRLIDGHFRLYFHDTHHRSLTDISGIAGADLRHYDGVLAYGEVIRQRYLRNGWVQRAWTFHEAADTRVFRPIPNTNKIGDLVWVGNWGDDERAEELREFLIKPVRTLGLRARVYGVRYPSEALRELAEAGIEYMGWLPNFRVPGVFAQHRVTIHVPRRPYAQILHGIPTIRPFEAMACGIPLISAPWCDSEHLFRPGTDFLLAQDGDEMISHLRAVLRSAALSELLASEGLATIRERHTCAHRAEQLLSIGKEETLGRVAALEAT
jgi:spore maturation protein CgeB